MYSRSKICFVGKFYVCIPDNYVRNNQFGKFIHDEASKDFLENMLHLFALKYTQSHGLFQVTKEITYNKGPVDKKEIWAES